MSDSSAAVSWAVTALAFCAAWLAAAVLHPPLFWYLPLDRQLVFGAHPPGLAMGLFGQLAFALGVGAAAGAGSWALLRKREPTATHVKLALGASVLMLGVVASYYAVTMWGRVP